MLEMTKVSTERVSAGLTASPVVIDKVDPTLTRTVLTGSGEDKV